MFVVDVVVAYVRCRCCHRRLFLRGGVGGSRRGGRVSRRGGGDGGRRRTRRRADAESFDAGYEGPMFHVGDMCSH